MTDRPGSPWRPAVPKKPADVKVSSVNTNVPAPGSLAAARGAAQAFARRNIPETTGSRTADLSGVKAAASVARNHSRPPTLPRPLEKSATGPVVSRGRQLFDQPDSRALGSLNSNTNGDALVSSRPTLGRNPSAIAARFASANPSPVRRELVREDLPSLARSPTRQVVQRTVKPNDFDEPLDAGNASNPRAFRPRQQQVLPSVSSSQTGLPTYNSQPVLNLNKIATLPYRTPTNTPQPTNNISTSAVNAAAAHAFAKSPPPLMPPSRKPRRHSPPDAATIVSPLPMRSEQASTKDLMANSSSSDEGNFADSLEQQNRTTAINHGIPKVAPIPILAPPPTRKPLKSPSAPVPVPHKDLRTGMTEQTLADAIVASSVASSRVGSPAQHDRPAIPPRRSKSHSNVKFASYRPDPVYEPRPVRPMRHTLRKPSKQDDDDEEEDKPGKRGRKHHFRKHPNKHHEGDRKRWRDKITERERKRYEGVWAANKGLFLFRQSSGEASFGGSHMVSPQVDMVVNVVVRDMWERSRLPRDILGEVWDLVAQENAMALKRDEFVVGMWLIDQRLKGRKLPTRVSQSVWASVRHTQGLKVSRKPL